MRGLLAAAFVSALSLLGCEDEGHIDTAFATFQDCFEDHTLYKQLPVPESILECCEHHPIGGVDLVCGAERADCINYLTANLRESDAGTVIVMETCDEYIFRLENPPVEE